MVLEQCLVNDDVKAYPCIPNVKWVFAFLYRYLPTCLKRLNVCSLPTNFVINYELAYWWRVVLRVQIMSVDFLPKLKQNESSGSVKTRRVLNNFIVFNFLI